MRRGHRDADEPGEDVGRSLPFPVTITSIQPQQRDPNRFSVFCEHGFVIGLSADLLIQSALRVGERLDQSRFEWLKSQDLMAMVRRQVIAWLSVRDHTRAELKRKAEKRFGPITGFDQILARVQELGLLDESRFAERFVRERSTQRGWGAYKIRQALVQKGLPPTEIEKALGQGLDEDATVKVCKDVLEKKKWYFDRFEDVRARRRSMASHLQRRGFPLEIIQRVLSDPKLLP